MITYLEQTIYNTYLKVSRTKQDKPFRFRKDFTDFVDTDKYIFVKKLGYFFNKFPHIDIEQFFTAPYEVFDDNDHYDLKFYTTPKATRMYGLYIKKINDMAPDSDIQIEFIKTSLMNMYVFCKDNKLLLTDYMSHKTNDLHTCISHLRERKVSVYVLMCFPDFDNILRSYPQSRLEFTLGKKFAEDLAHYKIRLYNCKRVQEICKEGLAKIKKLLIKLNKNI